MLILMNPTAGAGWNFIKSGQSASNAMVALDALLSGLSDLRGSPNSQPILAAQNYLLWAENAEAQLRAYFRDRDIARGLHTERYWRIRSMSESTHRPQPLIVGEVDDQELSLKSFRDQLDHYRTMLDPRESERMIVLDTNVFVHGLPFQQVRWNEQFSERRVRILLPLVVIDELDNLKNRGNHEAGGVLRDLDGLLPANAALSIVRLRDNVTLQLVDEPRGHARLTNLDDEIVQQSSYFSSVAGAPVTVVTQDRGMRVRAEAAGLPVLMLPNELKRRKDA